MGEKFENVYSVTWHGGDW